MTAVLVQIQEITPYRSLEENLGRLLKDLDQAAGLSDSSILGNLLLKLQNVLELEKPDEVVTALKKVLQTTPIPREALPVIQAKCPDLFSALLSEINATGGSYQGRNNAILLLPRFPSMTQSEASQALASMVRIIENDPYQNDDRVLSERLNAAFVISNLIPNLSEENKTTVGQVFTNILKDHQNHNPYFVARIAEYLPPVASKAKDAVSRLMELVAIEDRTPPKIFFHTKQQAAALALGNIGLDAKEAIPTIREALTNNKVPVFRHIAIGALGKILHGLGRTEETADTFQLLEEYARNTKDSNLSVRALNAMRSISDPDFNIKELD